MSFNLGPFGAIAAIAYMLWFLYKLGDFLHELGHERMGAAICITSLVMSIVAAVAAIAGYYNG